MADISSIKLPNNLTYDIKAKKIYYAECATASTDIAKVVNCDGFVLEKGAIIAIRFTDTGTTNPAFGNISLNINGTGAKNIVPKGSNTILTYSWGWAFRVNQTWIFIYNGTYFVWLNQDNNTTYNPMTLGFGYGTCTTAEATAAKVATLASYALVKNGIVSIKFTYAVPANATLNINNKGAKAIYYRGAKITTDVIDKGDIATFVYDGANYQLLTVDSKIIVDSTLSSTSVNPVQNKVINTALANKANSSHTHTISDITDLSEQISNIELLFDGILSNATSTSNPTEAVCRYDIYKTILVGVVSAQSVYYVGTYVLSNYTLNQMDINSYTSLYTSHGTTNSQLRIEISRNTDNINFSLRLGAGTYRIQIWGIT